MSADTIDSISEFLLHAGTNFRIFDMARGIYPVSAQEFLDMENGKILPPRPRQQHAWFGILFWHGNSAQQHYIWFVKLPLDEQGKVIAASRNHFLQIVVEALAASSEDNGAPELPDNPYSFKPSQMQMAQFSVLSRQALGKPETNDKKQALAYLKAPALLDWKQVSYQGIVDVASTLDDANLAKVIEDNYHFYPPEVVAPLLQGMENIELTPSLEQFLLAQLNSTMTPDDPTRLDLNLLRALTSQQARLNLQGMTAEIFTQHDALDMSTLSVISGRHYTQLSPALLLQFFEHAAKTDEQGLHKGELFTGFFSDLVQIPSLRPHVLGMLRSPARSEQLAKAIGYLFQTVKPS